MSATDAPWARWKVIDGSHAVRAQLEAADWLYHQICTALDCQARNGSSRRGVALLPMDPVPGEIGSGPGGEGVPEAAEEVPEGAGGASQ